MLFLCVNVIVGNTGFYSNVVQNDACYHNFARLYSVVKLQNSRKSSKIFSKQVIGPLYFVIDALQYDL